MHRLECGSLLPIWPSSAASRRCAMVNLVRSRAICRPFARKTWPLRERLERFQREGFDIIGIKEIPFALAALGGEVNIETIDGNLKLRIPGGTQPGTAIRLRGKGVLHLHGSGRGDHYVRIKVTVPKHLSGRQKELLKEFMEDRKSGWF